jgi:D-glycero-alpha-D-manno-heptose-7-phosphate kinase
MIIVRTPVRIPLGGGGTDLASYYSKHGGFLISAAINKYIYLSVNKRFEKNVRLGYSRTEIVENLNDIQHSIIREVMRLLEIECKNLEIVSMADIPSNSGLGTSSSFTVALIHSLQTYKRDHLTTKEIAEKACRLEIEILKEPIGKQDQYMAAFGGITCLEFSKDGEVTVTSPNISEETIAELERNILLFYTGVKRKSSYVLKEQKEAAMKEKKQVLEPLHEIKDIGYKIKDALEKGNPDVFGELLHLHWETKKKMSNKISSDDFDRIYEIGRNNGALGGKIMGAGGGGFFMFYCTNNRDKLREALEKEGLKLMRFRFDFDGSKIIANF